ncbi:MAG: phenylalanine--tRNA ligase subunit alpha [Phycisphaerae bacterium]|nr:phenylalanine--tRNA ligase subunit alpha [Phycisphaerae bacterium]
MNLDAFLQHVKDIERDAVVEIPNCRTVDALRALEARHVKAPLAEGLKQLKTLPAEARAEAGKALNEAKQRLTQRFDAAIDDLKQRLIADERAVAATYDPTIPGPVVPRGALHPVTAVQWEVERVMTGLGFTVVGGPEMETDFHNFEALNIPATHPARDTMDTFWLTNGWLLRTHTSPCQVRAMLTYGAPLRVIAPGRCFRYETIDASHENTFFQVEGLLIDHGISIAHLIAVMRLLLRELFQRDVKVRLRPGFFPFVEPGFELDMSCEICAGTGCPTCKQSGWVEILPCGMVHPNVLRYGNIDPHEFTGFAFGLGLTRLAMMKYGIADIRILNSGDLRGIVPQNRLTGPQIGGCSVRKNPA